MKLLTCRQLGPQELFPDCPGLSQAGTGIFTGWGAKGELKLDRIRSSASEK